MRGGRSGSVGRCRPVGWLSVALAVAAIGLLAAAVAVKAAGAGSAENTPFTVAAASVTQEGQELSWQVELSVPFSPTALVKDGRMLCLLVERPANGSVTGQVCVIGPARRSGAPRLVFSPVTGEGALPGHPIAATIMRPSDRELTASFLPSSIGLGYTRLRWQVISTLGPPACTPPTPGPYGCYTLFPSTPALVKLHTPRLVGCVPSGPSLVFNGSEKRRDIALTFDDGPWPYPPSIDFVDLLARYHVPATFFEIGEEIPKWDPTGSVERKMLAEGDMIGDHTWNHPDMVPLSPAEQTSELERASAAIRHATGFTTCLWKPPYGDISNQLDALARRLGFLTIYWDVDTVDWELPGTSAIYERAVSGAHNGAIIEMHFGGGPRYQTLDALPQMIDTLRARGYRFVNIAQMLGLKLTYR